MRRVTVASLLVCALSGMSAKPAAAEVIQIGCAEIDRPNSSYQSGLYGAWMTYIVETRTSPNICTTSMSVSAYVEDVAGTAGSGWGFFTATTTRQVPVGVGPRNTRGQHFVTILIFSVPFPIWFSAGETVSHANIEYRPEPDPIEFPDPVGECDNEYYWNGHECIPLNCPIIISMDHKAYQFTGLREGVPFDLNANGSLERVAWTASDSEIAFLALDRNGNGRIDSGAELFGNHTPVIPGTSATAPNGFEALRFAQNGSAGAADDVIDARDPVFERLLLWTDRNHNGISEPDEIQRLCDSGIIAISLIYKPGKRVDEHGNEFKQRGTIQWANGKTHTIYDVWLLTREKSMQR
jgi:hypothetical protein